MKVQCAWCQKKLPDKAPLEDTSVSHGICVTCERAQQKEIKRLATVASNPGDVPARVDLVDYMKQEEWVLVVGTRAQPKVFHRMVMKKNLQGYLHQYLQKSVQFLEAREWRLLHRTPYTAQASEPLLIATFPTLEEGLIRANREASEYLRNPGAVWHEKKEREANEQDRHATKLSHKDFFHGKSVAHLESGLAARAMQMNPAKFSWDMFAGGTSVPDKYHSYSVRTDIGTYYVSPFSRGSNGRMSGYIVNFTNELGKIQQSGLWRQLAIARSPNEGKKIAVKHYETAERIKENPLAVFTVGNPGRSWHTKKAAWARKKSVRFKEGTYAAGFWSGETQAHRDSAAAMRRNPPKQVKAGIAGVIYNRCLEIRAEKTGYKPGLYRHPFKKASAVQILALDNGDLLLHSTRGVKLWGQDE